MTKENSKNSGPEPLPEAVGRLSEFVRTHREKVAMAGTVVVLFIALMIGLGHYGRLKDASGAAQLQESRLEFENDVAKDGRDVALTRCLAKAPERLAEAKGSSSFGTSLMWYGGLALEKRDYEDAAVWFHEASGVLGDTALCNMAWCSEGLALEGLQRWDEALSVYDKIRGSGSKVRYVEATFLGARILEKQGNKGGALALFNEVAGDPAGSIYKAVAVEKASFLSEP